MSRGKYVMGTKKELEIVELRAQEKTQREIAAAVGVDISSVRRAIQRNEDLIREKQERLRLRLIEKLDRQGEAMEDGLLESASDPGNKNQPGSAKVLYEAAGLGRSGMKVHVGDNVMNATQINVDPELVKRATEEYDPALMRDLEERLGL